MAPASHSSVKCRIRPRRPDERPDSCIGSHGGSGGSGTGVGPGFCRGSNEDAGHPRLLFARCARRVAQPRGGCGAGELAAVAAGRAAQVEAGLKNRRVLIVDPAPGPKIPYQPWARAKQRELLDALFTPTKITDIEPEDRCAPMGVPRMNYRFDFEIDQSPGMVTMLYSWNHAYRMIPLDGRPHVPASIELFNGDSRGHWEGNTLVVDVTNFNDQTWFDAHGTIHTDALHVVERWTVVDANTINYEATLDDPKAFTRPWKIAYPIRRIKDAKATSCMKRHASRETIRRSTASSASAGSSRQKGVKGRHEHTPGFYDEK